MTKRPERIVDAHVHLWDPARTDWYPYLSGRMEIGMGNVTGMSRLFNPEIYQNDRVRVTNISRRLQEIETELVACLERWEALEG